MEQADNITKLRGATRFMDQGAIHNSYETQYITVGNMDAYQDDLKGDYHHTCQMESPHSYMEITCQDGLFACMESKFAKEKDWKGIMCKKNEGLCAIALSPQD